MSQSSVRENGRGYATEAIAQYVAYHLSSPKQAIEAYASPFSPLTCTACRRPW